MKRHIYVVIVIAFYLDSKTQSVDKGHYIYLIR